MRALVSRTLAISSSCRGRSRIRHGELVDIAGLGLGELGQCDGWGVVQIDQLVRQPVADGDLVHVGVRRCEEAAFLRHREHGKRVGAAGGANGGAFEWVESDIEAGALACAHGLADIEHRRLVPLALADHHRAGDIERVQAAPHGVDGGLIGGFLVAAANQPGCGRGAAASVTRTASNARLRSRETISFAASFPTGAS